ncbi:hypothetical protein EG244_17285 [Falsigemmobacter faecalis]|uniref:DUF2357 domain-containing protein n=1 Tax=Falsigemmobacter faecalis TaxID=2488730 RepID=A0A3P3D8M3_9RHOB|nr:hypothetical protein EG244_17285 [Falsigemmobacter faecalis]
MLHRPWESKSEADAVFRPEDCLLSEAQGGRPGGEHAVLMSSGSAATRRALLLHPYPLRQPAADPAREGFFLRPREGREEEAPPEARAALSRMNQVIARVQELGEALDDPSNLWEHLREAWDRAGQEESPRMAEIVRQSAEMEPVLSRLRSTLRRVLRRHRELTPMGRVQEMDRSSMRWLSRQPGRSIAERAGAGQRIMAVVRHEDFDTLENRVAHSYVTLAAEVGREWLREHQRASGSRRFQSVDSFVKLCRVTALDLQAHGIGFAEAGITPNYVLLENPTYSRIRTNWLRLLQRKKANDSHWAWQAQTWMDFTVLAIVLALRDLEGAELIAQSPILFREEAEGGIWFEQERPIAVFWLRHQGIVAEVMARPAQPGTALLEARAPVSLRITPLGHGSAPPHRVAVWAAHALLPIDLRQAAAGAAQRLDQVRRLPSLSERIRDGLILTPAHDSFAQAAERRGNCTVVAVALGAAGEALTQGRAAISAFLQRDIWSA